MAGERVSRITGEELRNLALASLGASIYAIGYFVRPIAGLVIAHFADRVGRKRLFILTIFLMSVPTLLIGLLPTYGQIGIGAPLLLLTLRILQGCAVGGELPSAAVFVTEHARPGRLFLASGTLHCVVHCGLLLGSGSAAIAALIGHMVPDASSLSWRLPFVLGGLFGLTAAYLRRRLSDTPLFSNLRAERQAVRLPLGTVLRRYRTACLFGLLGVCPGNGSPALQQGRVRWSYDRTSSCGELREVVGGADQRPFAGDLLDTA
jgi:MFS family permease